MADCGQGLKFTGICARAGDHMVGMCPYIVTTPTCSRLTPTSLGAVDDVCRLVAYTPTLTTCQCKFPVSLINPLFTARRLAGAGD